jgi:CheY-like chemotaxis protein
MSEDVRDQAFEPFFTTKERGKGTGLGLATVYGIAQAADGRVWIDSKVDRGTAVSVYLPASSETAVPEAVKTPAQLQGFGETVLLVEDDDLGRRATERILKENGYAVIALSDPEDALRVLEGGGRIELLVTDLIMPRLSGVELAKEVRERRPGIAVLYISGYAEGAIPAGTAITDDAPLIEKPFDASTLLAGVRSALDDARGQAIRELPESA